jgi:exodeoxyribonuclease VII small subunit
MPGSLRFATYARGREAWTDYKRTPPRAKLDSYVAEDQTVRMTAESQTISELSFEAALKRLEEIVRRLESGEASLDESIELYGEGDRLRQQCEARLQAAQARIEKIQLGRDGQPSGTIPFDGD